MRRRLKSGRAAVALVVAAAAVVALGVALGSGYTVARATMTDSTTYAAKGTAVTHVNGSSHRVDATSPTIASPGDDVRVVRIPGGRVVAVNRTNGTVTTLDGSTMRPTHSTPSTAPRAGGSESGSPRPTTPVDVVVAGRGGWIVDHDGSAVRRLQNGSPLAPVRLTGRPVDAAPARDGGVFVITDRGTLAHVAGAGTVRPIDLGDITGAALTVAGERAYLVTRAGAVYDLDAASPVKVADVAGSVGDVLAGSLRGSGVHVLIVSGSADGSLLTVVDPRSGKYRTIGVPEPVGTLGRPVEYRGRVYLPEYGERHRLLTFTVGTSGDPLELTQHAPLAVPGDTATFDVYVDGGRLWANDQYAQHLLEVDGDASHDVDKGSGDGTHDDRPRRQPDRRPDQPTRTGPPATSGSGPSSPDPGPSTPSRPAPPQLVRVPSFPPGTDVDTACAQLEALGPSCNRVSRSEKGRDTDEVLGTVPGGGVRVPTTGEVTVVYVGPTLVPDIPSGVSPRQACDTYLRPAGLRCEFAAAGTPAAGPDAFGTVAGTEPAAGQPVQNASPVTVRYYDRFTVPDWRGASGTAVCTRIEGLQLDLGRSPNVSVRCTAQTGNRAIGRPQLAGKVYQQSAAPGSEYRPGGRPLVLSIYADDAQLRDYRDSAGYRQTYDKAVADCSRLFRCVVSQQTRPAALGGPRPDLVNHVATMLDGGGAELPAGRYPVGSQTTVQIVRYVDQTSVPQVTGMTTQQDACAAVAQAGLACNPVRTPARMANVSNQSPAAGTAAAIGDPVTVYYFDRVAIPLTKWKRAGSAYTEQVHLLLLQNEPPPAGYIREPDAAWAFAPNPADAGNVINEYHGDCTGHPDNILYDRGRPDGCMANGFRRVVANTEASVDGTTCPAGMLWLWRISRVYGNDPTAPIGSYQNQHSNDVILGTASRGDTPAYPEPYAIGCVFAP